jgi:hypothetical protein
VSVHVLAHALTLPRVLRTRVPGTAIRVGVLGAVLLGGLVLATATLPAADRLQDHASEHIGFDDR